jgi:hypothetical protein
MEHKIKSPLSGRSIVIGKTAYNELILNGFTSDDLSKNIMIKIITNNVYEIVQKYNEDIFKCFGEYMKESETQNADLILLIKNHNVAGLAFMEKIKKKYLLHTVCLFSQYQGQGLCTPFIKLIIYKYKHETKKIELEVKPNNIAAIKCYEKAGFKTNYIQMSLSFI